MTPVLGYLVVMESYTLACIVFTIAGITDLVIICFLYTFIAHSSWLLPHEWGTVNRTDYDQLFLKNPVLVFKVLQLSLKPG